MADLTTYTCSYCKRKFRNRTKALFHEIEEKIAHNPNPMYSLCVDFGLTNHLIGNSIDIRILREKTYFDDEGRRLEFCDYYRDPEMAGRPFDYKENVWFYSNGWNGKEVNPKEFLQKQLEFREDDQCFNLKIFFTDWTKISEYLKEIHDALPDKDWIDGFREYFRNAFKSTMRKEIDDSHDAVRKILENGNGEWSKVKIGDFGYGSYEKKGVSAKDSMKYGLREKDEGSLYVWVKKEN